MLFVWSRIIFLLELWTIFSCFRIIQGKTDETLAIYAPVIVPCISICMEKLLRREQTGGVTGKAAKACLNRKSVWILTVSPATTDQEITHVLWTGKRAGNRDSLSIESERSN